MKRAIVLTVVALGLTACSAAQAASGTVAPEDTVAPISETNERAITGAPTTAVPPTTLAPPTTVATTVPPTTTPPTTTAPPPPPPPPGPAPIINITCPTPKTDQADSVRAEFGYDFHATAPELVRWGMDYGDGRSYTADNEEKARKEVFWHRYGSPQTYTATAWVEDAIGRRASDSCQFTWTAPPPEIVPDPPYRFNQAADGEPIRWRACTSMHWRYNPAGEPSPQAIEVVRAAMAEISAASGVETIEDGVTSIDVSDPDQAGTKIAEGEVVIGFAPPESPAIRSVGGYDPNVSALGSTHAVWNGSDMNKASVALNSEAAVKLPLDFSSQASLGAVLLHEIGHVVGLQHVGPSTQIMTPQANRNAPGHLGTGDLAGLATLRNRPCAN